MFSSIRDYRPVLMLFGATACWGIATVITKRGLAEIAPLALLPIQLMVSVVFLIILTRAGGNRVSLSPELRRLGLLGVLNPGVSYALSLAGLAHITASLSVLLWTVEPLLILVLARLVLGDRITRFLAVTMLIAFGGVGLIVFQTGSLGSGLGASLTLAGVGACAVYTVLCRRLLVKDSTLSVVVVQQACALVFAFSLLGALSLTGQTSDLDDVSVAGWLSAIVSGVLYYAVAFWFYLTGLRKVPAAIAGAFINLVPVFGITAGYVLLSERLTARQWLGAAIVLVAVTATVTLHRPTAVAGEVRPRRV
ncbi:MAG: DMT family transporter [Actinobacteria bacterium]|nr:DMT family transporter [Actinomycetota bacterium]